MADRFVRACRWAGRVAGNSIERRLMALEKAIRVLEREEPTVRLRASTAATKEAVALQEKARGMARRRERLQKIRDQPSFTAAVRLAGIPVTFEEVSSLASLLAGITAAVLLPLAAAGTLLAPSLALVLLPAALGVPVGVYAVTLGYPESRARRLRVLSLGRAPEAVNYLALALRLRPSLTVAVRFAAEGTEEPMAGMLRRLLWSVSLRETSSVEEAFHAFAESWRGWNEDLRRALHDLSAAARQGGEDAVARFCDRARELVREGTKERVRAYAGSLRGPAAALFALGVLLPLTLGTVLPMTSLGSLDVLSGAAPSPGLDPLLVILLLDAAFPAATFLLAYVILGRRPGLGSLAPVSSRLPWRRAGFAGLVAGAAASMLFLAPPPVSGIAAILVAVAAVSAALFVAGRGPARKARELRALEDEFPDALFRLGALVGAGMPPETALGRVAEEMPASPVADLFTAIAHAVRLRRVSLREVLFGPDGLLASHPSRLVRSSMRLVVEVTARDPATAARGILETAAYLRDLRRLEGEMRESLRSTVESVRATATFFAPLVLGITCALYAMLGGVFSSLGALPLSPATFNAASAAYLALSFVASTYFAVGVERGEDRATLLESVGRGLPIALAVFVLGLSLGGFLVA